MQRTMDEFLTSEIAQGAGWTTVGLSLFSAGIELLSQINFNDTLQFLLSLGGLVFLWFKIRMIRLDYQIKKDQHKKQKDE